jgi:hypothetical protein
MQLRARTHTRVQENHKKCVLIFFLLHAFFIFCTFSNNTFLQVDGNTDIKESLRVPGEMAFEKCPLLWGGG